MAWRGLFFAAEYFRRHQIDDFTFRPQLADGAYGQLAYYFVIADTLGLADPMVAIPITDGDVSYRIGLVTARRDPRPPILTAFWEESALPDAA